MRFEPVPVDDIKWPSLVVSFVPSFVGSLVVATDMALPPGTSDE